MYCIQTIELMKLHCICIGTEAVRWQLFGLLFHNWFLKNLFEWTRSETRQMMHYSKGNDESFPKCDFNCDYVTESKGMFIWVEFFPVLVDFTMTLFSLFLNYVIMVPILKILKFHHRKNCQFQRVNWKALRLMDRPKDSPPGLNRVKTINTWPLLLITKSLTQSIFTSSCIVAVHLTHHLKVLGLRKAASSLSFLQLSWALLNASILISS